MYEEFFSQRISSLRNQKNVSAREVSLSIGQNESYINRIENKKTFPSMQCFFYICEYFNITPRDFFDVEESHLINLKDVITELKDLDSSQLETILAVAKGLKHK